MPKASRSRVLNVGAAQLWLLVSDPRRLPDWWPGVERVENVGKRHFTQVMRSSRGRPVRADYVVANAQPAQQLRWEQELAGTPFERFFKRNAITIALVPNPDGTTKLTLVVEQSLIGASRLGAPLVFRAARRQLAAALKGAALLQ